MTPAPRLVHQLGELFLSPADLELEPGSLVQPDLFVARAHDGVGRAFGRPDIASLPLSIEVLSPTTARQDRVTKREFHLRAAVEEYWIVDLDARFVERWQPEATRPEVASDRLPWSPSGAKAPLELDFRALFEAILGP